MKIVRIGVFLFALPFFGFGVGFFSFMVYPDLRDWMNAQDWLATDATLIDANLKINRSSKSTTYEATATYQYSFHGQSYTNNRVALSTGADNIGSFQAALGRQLENSYHQKRPIRVWVNPNNPQQSLIDRSMRWGLISLKLIFVLAFTGFGALFMYAATTKKAKQRTNLSGASSDDKPWLSNKEWSSPVILSSAKKTLWMMWAFAVFWNALTIPVAFQVPKALSKGEYGILVALIFNVIGVVLLILAMRKTLEWKKYGASPLTMDPHPGSIGGQVGGYIDVNIPFKTDHDYKITLSNIHSYVSGSGKNRSRHESVEWQDVAHVKGAPGSKGTRVSFCFDVPSGLTGSQPHSNNHYKWNLGLTINLPGIDLDRTYEIPVFATGEQSRYVDQDRIEQQFDEASVDLPYTIQPHSDGTHLYFPPGRSKGMAFILSTVGSLFMGTGIFLGYQYWTASRPETMLLIMGSAFFLVGLLLDLGGVYTLINSLEVMVGNSGVKTIRKIAGIPLFQRNAARHEIRDIKVKRGAQSGNTVYYSIFIHTNQGKQIKVGESFVGASSAEKSAAQIKKWLGF